MARSPLPLPTRLPRTKGQWVMAVLAVLVALAFWWWQERVDAPPTADREPDRPAASATVAPHDGGTPRNASVDPETGLPLVEVEDLPDEAEETLELIDDDGPFPYDEDGTVFGNFEGILPDHVRGYYHEYTVETPGLNHRGPLRIVTGDEDEYFWTEDHYASFARIQR
ncbi:ribonuclease domain-containing protein [Nocardioides sp.]|uniref:ribonuclease domain-containing protein n=1 Tax=Nocardioides sp. TaxID=35761 RepID=UPI002B70FEC5|nr:ribonuclease domain-containing protein [Nocardioides sp.]HSX67569.1 ribonuclease domain-containing protein [Nocardioides sp.]